MFKYVLTGGGGLAKLIREGSGDLTLFCELGKKLKWQGKQCGCYSHFKGIKPSKIAHTICTHTTCTMDALYYIKIT